MKKVILCMAVLAMGALKVSAQSESAEVGDFKFGIGATFGLPLGDIKSASGFVYGADLKGEYTVASNLAVSLSAGYIKFSPKSGYETNGIIPILAGGKYHFSENIYGQAQLGMSISTASGGGSAFTYAPSIGYDINENFNVELRYQAASKGGGTSSFFGLRIGRTF
jgi:Outer membrane protein beta-barrel domain